MNEIVPVMWSFGNHFALLHDGTIHFNTTLHVIIAEHAVYNIFKNWRCWHIMVLLLYLGQFALFTVHTVVTCSRRCPVVLVSGAVAHIVVLVLAGTTSKAVILLHSGPILTFKRIIDHCSQCRVQCLHGLINLFCWVVHPVSSHSSGGGLTGGRAQSSAHSTCHLNQELCYDAIEIWGTKQQQVDFLLYWNSSSSEVGLDIGLSLTCTQ